MGAPLQPSPHDDWIDHSLDPPNSVKPTRRGQSDYARTSVPIMQFGTSLGSRHRDQTFR
jgi:hypothetical protein